MFLPPGAPRRGSRTGRLSANFDYICQQPILPPDPSPPSCPLIPPQLKYRHAPPTPYSWTLSTKPVTPRLPLPFLRILTIVRPIRFTTVKYPPSPSRVPSTPAFAKTYLVDVPVGDARCNFVSRYVSRMAKVQDENCAF